MPISFRIVLVFFLLYHSLHGQTITMSELFDLFRKNHPHFSLEELKPHIKQRNRDIAGAARNWRIQSGTTFLYRRPVEPSSFSPDRLLQASLTGGAGKSVWASGGRLSAEWSFNLTDQNLPVLRIPSPVGNMPSFSIGLDRFYKNRILVNYTQPLWQNFKGTLDRLDYELANFDVSVAEYQSVENKERFLLRIGNLFIDWVLLSENERIMNERYELAQKQYDLVREQRRAFLVDQVDELRAKDAVRIAEQSRLLMRSRLNAIKSELAVMVREEKIKSMTPDFPLYAKVDMPSPEDALKNLEDGSRSLDALSQQRCRLERLQAGFVERKNPRLDLNVGAGLIGGDERFGGSFDISNPDLRATLSFSYPLGRRIASIQEQKLELQIRQMALQHESVLLELKSNMATVLIRLREMENILQINQQQIESARERMEEEKKLYEQGRGQLNFVIQARDNLQNSKSNYAENAATYQKMVLQYQALSDRLVKSF